MIRKSCFTLVEILCVIAIIAILVGLIVGGASFASRRAAETKTLSKLKQMEMALDAFKRDRGYYPRPPSAVALDGKDSNSDLPYEFMYTNFVYSDANGGGNYLDGYRGGEYLDAWGTPFWYRCPGYKNPEMYDLWSVGPDKDHGKNTDSTEMNNSPWDAGEEGSDDICNWKRYQ